MSARIEQDAGSHRASVIACAAAFVVPLALYALTAARTVQGGDTGELVLVAALGGVPHPPGYPLYTALARLAAAVPVGGLVLRLALLSALCGAGAAAVLQRVIWRLTGSVLASLGGALAFAVTPVAWRLAGVPEVFSLGALLAALVVLATLRLLDSAPAAATRAAFLVGLAFGAGLSNHHTIVLLAPLPLVALGALARRAGWRCAAGAAGAALGGLALGLLPYALLPVFGRGDGWVWGEPTTLRGLLRHVARAEYGTLQLGLARAARRPGAHVWHLVAALPRAYFWVYFGAGLVGVVALGRGRRAFAAALGAAFLLAGVAFPAWFNLPDTPTARAVAERFHLLPTLLVAVPVGVGLHVVLRRASRAAGILLATLPLPLAALLTFGGANWRADDTVERYLAAAVRDLAPDAVVLGQGDLELFGFQYVTRVRRLRPDVRYVDVNLLRQRWYHDQVRRALPEVEIPFDAATTRLAPVVAGTAARRPTYLTVSLARTAAGIPAYPEGLLARVPAPGSSPPPPTALLPAVSRAFAALRPVPTPTDPWGAYVRDQAAEPLRALASALAAAGEPEAAATCRARAALLTSAEPIP